MRFDVPRDERVRREKLFEAYKLKRRYQHIIKSQMKISFPDDILQINSRKISYEFFGLKAYKISPPIISVRGHVRGKNHGFDVYLSGFFNYEMSVVVCYAKVGERQFERVKIYELSGDTHEITSETKMSVKYFEQQYLRKRCQFEVIMK